MSQNKCRFLLYHCSISVIYQETSLSISFICSCIKVFLILTPTKTENVEIIQCLQFTFCTDTWRQFHICVCTVTWITFFMTKTIQLSRLLFDFQNKREYRHYNNFAVLSHIYTRLVIFVPYHDCCRVKTMFTMLLYFQNISEVLCLCIVGLLSQVNL